METIGNVIEWLYSNVFYYEIMTNEEIEPDPTEDALHRHILEDFVGFDSNSYEVLYHIDDRKWYLLMTLEIGNYCDEYEHLPATVSNLRLATSDCPEMIFSNHSDTFDRTDESQGKFIIPESFFDSVYPVDEDDYYGNSIDVTFKFAKVEDDRLIKYLKIMDTTKMNY